ncbi:glycosyltransferase family 4 protein [Bacillus sp. 03113]|uniref:glycosyltransferase family 4 protein n=1 Tax=Bacillus sp. 03113 TaxID=2578211 RepID=UPI0011443FAB|nr:glycosyltransferase family 4 protein [Bacillus sp. 03113]
MKVLMICTEKLPIPPVLGGAIQTYIAGNLPFLRKNHKVTVLGTNDPSLPDSEIIDGINYVRVPGKILEIYMEGVVRYIEGNQFDLIHIFNRPRLVLPVRKAAPHSKITLSMHNDMFNPEKINPEEAKEAIEQVSNIITVSNYIGNVIKNLYPQASSKVRTIYSGVDAERFLPGNHPKMRKIRHQLRQENGIENKTVIFFAGRLSHNKGVDLLIRALPELSKRFKDLAVVIAGSKWFSQDGITDYIAYVKSLAKKLTVPVISTGYVKADEIQNWFAAADLFVCTSQWQEPLARVHYEAMAAGLPIITTARGGNPEVIQPSENGFVIENPEDPSQFAEKISMILSNKAMMRKMGERGREIAISRYQWNRVASELLEVWEQSAMPSTSLSPVSSPEKVTNLTTNDTKKVNKVKTKKAETNKKSISFSTDSLKQSEQIKVNQKNKDEKKVPKIQQNQENSLQKDNMTSVKKEKELETTDHSIWSFRKVEVIEEEFFFRKGKVIEEEFSFRKTKSNKTDISFYRRNEDNEDNKEEKDIKFSNDNKRVVADFQWRKRNS